MMPCKCPCSRQCSQSVVLERTLFFSNKTPSSFYFSESCSWAESKASPPLCFCKVRAVENCMQALYIEQGIFQGTGCQRAASICLFPSPLFLAVSVEGRGHQVCLLLQTAQYDVAFPHEWWGHFTDYKNFKTQAQEMYRMRARYCLH